MEAKHVRNFQVVDVFSFLYLLRRQTFIVANSERSIEHNNKHIHKFIFLDNLLTPILNQNKELSRYSLNTLKHQFTSRFSSQFFKNIRQNIVYKHAERTVGSSYNVWDTSIIADFNSVSFTVTANNIFDTEYIEAGYVPMPSSSLLFGMRFRL